jgi:osmotically-inducible protein OsmY
MSPYPSHRRRLVWCCLCLLVAGCSRQDTECLARLGRKLVQRAQSTAEEIGGKLELGWKSSREEPGVLERVEQRLRGDKFLATESIEVLGNEVEVQLRGTVKTAQQRERALRLVESTVGVERVSADALRALEP